MTRFLLNPKSFEYKVMRFKLLHWIQSPMICSERHCFAGSDVSILANVAIGDNVIIGAGSVVNKDIPSNCLVAGGSCTNDSS